MTVEFRQCRAVDCRFRFPVAEHERRGQRCPLCGETTDVVASVAAAGEMDIRSGQRLPFAVIVDNVRSIFNVGSIVRSADAAGVQHLHLCGVTPSPNHPKLAKTALGAQLDMSWSHHNNALDLAHALQQAGWTLWALEECPPDSPLAQRVISLTEVDALPDRLALVIGSEVAGVDPGLLALCECIVQIPMRGAKRSLNVATAFGVAAVLLAERMARQTNQER
jgi:23S rRNA (guanosine2251-2'-O)-methyltransferase